MSQIRRTGPVTASLLAVMRDFRSDTLTQKLWNQSARQMGHGIISQPVKVWHKPFFASYSKQIYCVTDCNSINTTHLKIVYIWKGFHACPLSLQAASGRWYLHTVTWTSRKQSSLCLLGLWSTTNVFLVTSWRDLNFWNACITSSGRTRHRGALMLRVNRRII